MYNNLLWSNWGRSLCNVYMIGNAFSTYEERYVIIMLLLFLTLLQNLIIGQKQRIKLQTFK